MQDLHYAIKIHAPKEKVWDTMLGESTYPEWTGVFMPGSYYKGTWEKGSEIDFLAPDPDGTESGMRARIVENVPGEFVSMEHFAEIRGGNATPFDAHVTGFENYTFKEEDGVTEVSVDLLNLPDEWAPMMAESWPKALDALRKLIEG